MMSYVGEPLSPGAPPSYDDPAPVDEIRVGWLYKRSRLGLCWNRRWVSAADGQLTTHADASSPTKLTVTLAYATVQLLSSSRDRYRFEVGTALGARFEFAAETSRDANDWVRFLRSQIGPQPRRRARDRVRSSRAGTGVPCPVVADVNGPCARPCCCCRTPTSSSSRRSWRHRRNTTITRRSASPAARVRRRPSRGTTCTSRSWR